MGILDFFRRNVNKRAESRPRAARDYTSMPSFFAPSDTTAFTCMDRIANEIGMLNYGIFSRSTKKKVSTHPLLAVLREPNLEEGHYIFFYQSVMDYFSGGVYWLLGRGTGGQVVSLFRLAPREVSVRRNPIDNSREYLYGGRVYTSDDILFIPSRFNYSSLSGGRSIFDAMQGAFALSGDIDRFTHNSFTNGVGGKRVVIDISGVTSLNEVTDDQVDSIRNRFIMDYGGIENAGKPLVKKRGVNYEFEGGDGNNNRAQELLDNRRFQEHEMAKLFHVPDALLSGSTEGMDIEKIFTLFSEFALKPIATQFQESINSLFDNPDIFFEFDFNGILKVSLSQRVDAYVKQINNGLLSVNEARRKENLGAVEAGDNHFMPVNLMPLNEETVEAYMAKQKQLIAGQGASNPTDPNAKHFGGGDDKQ